MIHIDDLYDLYGVTMVCTYNIFSNDCMLELKLTYPNGFVEHTPPFEIQNPPYLPILNIKRETYQIL